MEQLDEYKNKHEAQFRVLEQENKSLSKELEKKEKEKSQLERKNN
jgi:hypothetical protein